jgi:hypothetical protein
LRWARAIGPAGQQQRLGFQRRARARTNSFRPPEQREGVVAGRIGARRRGAEPQRGIEHALQQRSRRHVEPRPRDGAQRVAREEHGRAVALAAHSFRMLHVGGGEHLEGLTAGDPLSQQSGGRVGLRDRAAAWCTFESLCHLGERRPQRAGGGETHRLGGGRHGEDQGREKSREPHEVGSGCVAFGKNSCSPLIW